MKFLAILIAFFLQQHFIGANPLRRWLPLDTFCRAARGLGFYLGFLLAVVIPCLVVFALLYILSYGFLWFFVGLLVLLYHLDEYDVEAEVDDRVLMLRDIDEQYTLADAAEEHEEFVSLMLERLYQSFIPVLFWFLVLGPVASLFYVLLIAYLDILDDNDRGVTWLTKLVFGLDYLPIRITGLLFSLVGRFSPSFDLWLAELFEVQTHVGEYLAIHASVADEDWSDAVGDDVQDFARVAEHQLTNILSLWQRTLYGWLGLAALVTIVG